MDNIQCTPLPQKFGFTSPEEHQYKIEKANAVEKNQEIFLRQKKGEFEKLFSPLKNSTDYATVAYQALIDSNIKKISNKSEQLKFRNLFATALCLEQVVYQNVFHFLECYRPYCDFAPLENKLEKNEEGNPIIYLHMMEGMEIPEKHKDSLYNNREIKNNEEINIIGLSTETLENKEQETEAFIFYFLTMINFLKNGYSRLIDDDEGLHLALKSSNPLIKATAEQIFLYSKSTKLFGKLDKCLDEITNFYHHAKQLLNQHINLNDIVTQLPFCVEGMNILGDFLRSELTTTRYAVNLGVVARLEKAVEDWKATHTEKIECYQNNFNILKNLRPKKNFTQYVKEFENHYYAWDSNISISEMNNRKSFLETAIPIRTQDFVSKCNTLFSLFVDQIEKKEEVLLKEKKPKKKGTKKQRKKQGKRRENTNQDSPTPLVSYSACDIQKIKKKNLPYSDRVLDWFTNSPKQLQNESYACLSEKSKAEQKLFHGFNIAVDYYLDEFAYLTSWDNLTTNHKDNLYLIAGEIITSGKVIRGFYTYALGKDGCYYHRGFKKIKDMNEMISLVVNNAFDKIDFPSILEAETLKANKCLLEEFSVHAGEAIIKKHKVFGSIHIKDPKLEAEFVLYPRV